MAFLQLIAPAVLIPYMMIKLTDIQTIPNAWHDRYQLGFPSNNCYNAMASLPSKDEDFYQTILSIHFYFLPN